MSIQRVAIGHLDDLAQVHHGDPVGDVLHHREVVRDEQIREVELPLQVVQEVQDLCLDRDVERRHGFVAHDQLRTQRERSGDADPLPLTTRELVRVPVVVLGVEAHELHQLLDLALDLVLRHGLVQPEGDPMIVPIVLRGLSDA